MPESDVFVAFVRSRSPDLVRSAWLLTGDWATAQDLVQVALMKTWQRWAAVRRQDAPEAYVRRVVMSTFLSWRRRRWVGELATDRLREGVDARDVAGELADSAVVVAALRRLPRQQRAVVVLRYFDDLSETTTAAALGCSVGTVKTHAHRALRALRADLDLQSALDGRSR